MGNRIYEAFRRVNRTRRPEGSVALRATVLAAVLIAVVAVWVQGAADPLDSVVALILLPVGAVVSYRRRASDNTVIKLMLTVGAAYALYRFFGQLQSAATIEDTRVPLANLFLAVQILHGFDLPQRRDLGFTLASSLTLVALAASSARGSAFGLLLIAYLLVMALASAALQRAAARDEADDIADEEERARLVPVTRDATSARDPSGRWLLSGASGLLRASVPALLAGLLVFLMLPRADVSRFGGLPFEGFGGGQVDDGRVVNPGLPYQGAPPSDDDGPPPFNPASYFGFAEWVDLRTRGELSEELVLRVRADRPRFWRGVVFDTYEDSHWTRTAEEPEPTDGIPVRLPFPRYPYAELDQVIQTYEIVKQTPNLVFAAADPFQIYLSGGSASLWDDGTVTTSQDQEAGIVYSVISLVDVSPREKLRAATGEVPDEVADTYLQIPDSLPERVRALGRELTAQGGTTYEKAEAVQAWLGDNVEYSLDLTGQPPGADAVDWFLFEHRRGWCESIASSMVMLLRSGGVPARFVTGFAPGVRNPFSGWYEVRVADAHAWVEVWIPGHGWTAFDPTGAVPQAVAPGELAPRFAAVDLARWLRERIP
ncbi:MAG: DUF3488 domain-containing protein, partial [Actinobacteria bacterium]|nr:DUF3488 domain-containing protein [Actinomycetota bacterium]